MSVLFRTVASIATASILSACSNNSTDSGPQPPPVISVCEMNNSQVCGTWTRQANGTYAGTWEDGATATLTLTRFTKTQMSVSRVDYGKNQNFTATYEGTVNGRTAAGQVTWNIQGTSVKGQWSATW